ncbi:zinc finger protein ZAT4-like [Hibiscus syriacus]|uniref:zinc finger protein ZAT4-like n=1 Tax=Hibiscus syriacus TaxID=106335 RepID=UPI001922390D|nr:zinc finger protein ZAT4-like [Hibiscus syriacus]
MEQNQKKKFVCKYCNKGYPSGKSLGGHIRTHMNNENSAEAGGQSATYDLRENPKKNKRLSESGNGSLLKEMMICKECGKGFHSLKALCGHMACHSEKERTVHKFEDHWDSHSDTETSTVPGRSRRSRRIRCKTSGVHQVQVHSNDSVCLPNGSSSASEIEDQQEQAEVAVCLMMLSRDSSGCKKGLNAFADSSYYNSVVLDAKSSSIDVRIVECKKLKVRSRSGKNVSKFKCVKTEVGDNQADSFANGSFHTQMTGTKVTKFSNGNSEKRLVSKKNKGHECPFCCRVFKSGQALGGHKRSHFVGGSEETTLVTQQDSPETPLPALIDLNLPAPVEEDAMGNSGFIPTVCK